MGLNSAFIIILLLNCCSEDRRDLPWPVQTCIHAPYFRQCSDIDIILAAPVRFKNAKTHTIRRCRLVYNTATTSAAHRRDPDTHEMRGVWRGGWNGLHAPRQHLRRSAFLIRIYIIGWGFCFWSLSDGFLAKSVAGRPARAERPCSCPVSSSGRCSRCSF